MIQTRNALKADGTKEKGGKADECRRYQSSTPTLHTSPSFRTRVSSNQPTQSARSVPTNARTPVNTTFTLVSIAPFPLRMLLPVAPVEDAPSVSSSPPTVLTTTRVD